MEAVGLTAFVASLASVFETAAHSFEYIQVGESIGVDTGTCSLKLDKTHLQLKRHERLKRMVWGGNRI